MYIYLYLYKAINLLFDTSQLSSELRQIRNFMESFIEQLQGLKSGSNVKLKTQ